MRNPNFFFFFSLNLFWISTETTIKVENHLQESTIYDLKLTELSFHPKTTTIVYTNVNNQLDNSYNSTCLQTSMLREQESIV